MIIIGYLLVGFISGCMYLRYSDYDGGAPGLFLAFWTIAWPLTAFVELCEWTGKNIR